MAQQPENKNQAKGFSGLDSMVSDVSKDVEHAERVGQSSQSRSEAAAPQASGKAATAPATPGSIEKETGASSGSSGIKWVLGAAAFIFVVWLIGNSSKQETPTYNPPPVTVPAPAPAVIPSPVPAPAPAPSAAPRPSGVIGEKPPVGDAHVLDREQIRYCLSEKIRLDAIETIVNASRNLEVDKFNGLVADYNSRCAHFRYRRGSLESVGAEVEAQQSAIEHAAQSAWLRDSLRLATPPKGKRDDPREGVTKRSASTSDKQAISPPPIKTSPSENQQLPSTPSPSGGSRTYPDLMTAVMLSDTNAVEYFLSRGVDINEKKGESTYLIAATRIGNVDMVKFLVSKGADVNQPDRRGFTPIVHAKAARPPDNALIQYLESAGATNPFVAR